MERAYVSGQFLVVIGMMVAPVPVFALLFGRKRPKFAVGPVSLRDPLVVVDNFVVIPDVVVAVVGVVDPILRVRRTSGDHDGSSKSTSKKKRT